MGGVGVDPGDQRAHRGRASVPGARRRADDPRPARRRSTACASRGSATAPTSSSRSPRSASCSATRSSPRARDGYEAPRASPTRPRPARGGRRARTSSSPTSGSAWARSTSARQRLRDLEPYRLDATLLSLAAPDAFVMHCLPAHPGEEITADVLYGDALGRLGRGREPPARPEGAARAAARRVDLVRREDARAGERFKRPSPLRRVLRPRLARGRSAPSRRRLSAVRVLRGSRFRRARESACAGRADAWRPAVPG